MDRIRRVNRRLHELMQKVSNNPGWGGKPMAGRGAGWWALLCAGWLASVVALQAQTGRPGDVQVPEKLPAAGVPKTAGTNLLAQAAYRIRGGDLLELKVYQEEDLNARVRVEADGAVVLPLVGRLTVRDLTVEEAQRLVRDRLEAEFLNNPQVTLTITEFSPQRYSVMGQVARPGVYQIPPGERVTLLQAIATAGSYTRIASPANVKVKRRGPNGMEVIPVNAKAMASDPTKVFFVETDDEVLVGESAL